MGEHLSKGVLMGDRQRREFARGLMRMDIDFGYIQIDLVPFRKKNLVLPIQ